MLTQSIAATVVSTWAIVAATSSHAQISVRINPDDGPHAYPIQWLAQSTPDSVKFYVVNTSPLSAPDVHFAMACASTGNITTIISCAPANPLISPQDSIIVTVKFTAGTAGSGRIQLTATYVQSPGATAVGGWDITIVDPTQVTPKDSLMTPLPAAGLNRAIFRIKNNSSATRIYSLTIPTCNSAAIGCSLSRTVDTISAGASDTATITFSSSAGVGDTGHVRLAASATGIAPDTGSIRVTVTNAMVAPTISSGPYNPGIALERDECLTIGLGGPAAATCGNLTLSYQLPAFKILNITRAPTLIYDGGTAQVVPQVAVKVTIPNLTQAPDIVEAVLKIGGTVRGRQQWSGLAWDVHAVPRYIRVRDTTNPSTGLLNYTVEVTSMRSGASPVTSSTTQQVLVVNRQSSSFGSGWWLAGDLTPAS